MATEITHRTTAQLGAYLEDIIFPCSRHQILECAEDNEAPDLLLDAIEGLPERRYRNIREVLERLSGRA